MCDSSATLGSIETTYAQKRQFAYDSLAFNIQDPIFCELFPDITNEIKKILDERTAKLSTMNSLNNVDQEQSVVSSTLNSGSTSTSWLNNLIGNLMILALLAVFAIVVRFILNSTAEIQ
jgi:hypothetical protein